MRCPRCQVENREGAGFCKGCGGPLAAPAARPSSPRAAACPACGVANAAGARFCKKCGQALSAAPPARPPAPPAPGGIPCAACRAPNAPGAKFCKKCGGSLAPAPPPPAPPPPGPAPAAPAPPGAACPACRHPNAAGARFCKKCGRALAAPPEEGSCPSCGHPNPKAAKFCQKCGRPATPQPAPAAAETFPDVDAEAAFTSQPVTVGSRPGAFPVGSGPLKDPDRLLAPAGDKGFRSKLNVLEWLSMGGVVALVSVFYLFGLLKFGFSSMLRSGTPLFGGYVLGLLFGLAILRRPMDLLLKPVNKVLQKVPAGLRMALGVGLPLLWVMLDSKDMGSGFAHAGFTVTIATLLGHVFFRSLRREEP